MVVNLAVFSFLHLLRQSTGNGTSEKKGTLFFNKAMIRFWACGHLFISFLLLFVFIPPARRPSSLLSGELLETARCLKEGKERLWSRWHRKEIIKSHRSPYGEISCSVFKGPPSIHQRSRSDGPTGLRRGLKALYEEMPPTVLRIPVPIFINFRFLSLLYIRPMSFSCTCLQSGVTFFLGIASLTI